jgi:hypothetical protein
LLRLLVKKEPKAHVIDGLSLTVGVYTHRTPYDIRRANGPGWIRTSDQRIMSALTRSVNPLQDKHLAKQGGAVGRAMGRVACRIRLPDKPFKTPISPS